jgi:hypothetical protein
VVATAVVSTVVARKRPEQVQTAPAAAPSVGPAAGPEEPVDGDQNGGSWTDGLKDAAPLLTVFAGIATFVGLKNNEISDVLRNEVIAPFVLSGMLLLAILMVLVGTGEREGTFPGPVAGAVLGLSLGLGGLTIYITPIPYATHPGYIYTTAAITSSLLVAGAVCGVIAAWSRRRKLHRVILAALCATLAVGIIVLMAVFPEKGTGFLFVLPDLYVTLVAGAAGGVAAGLLIDRALAGENLSRRLVWLVSVTVIIASAGYGAVRLETRSQVEQLAPQVSASLSAAGADDAVSVTTSESRLREGSYIGVAVNGLLRSAGTFPGLCAGRDVGIAPTAVTCTDDPCNAHYDLHCQEIDGMIVQPDSDGEAKETVTALVSRATYQDLEVVARLCTVEAEPKANSQATCSFTNGVHSGRLNLLIPGT